MVAPSNPRRPKTGTYSTNDRHQHILLPTPVYPSFSPFELELDSQASGGVESDGVEWD